MTYTAADHAAMAAELKRARASLAGTGAALRAVTAERDRARRIAVALENKLAEARSDLAANDQELNNALLHNDETCSAVAERDRLARELAALREATPDLGYCPECGRGDCSPGHAEWQHQYQRAERAETERDQHAAAIDRVRAAVHIADDQDVTNWQRGYRACANRATDALADPEHNA